MAAVFGEDLTEASGALPLLALAMALLACAYLAVQYLLALERANFLIILGLAAAAELVLLPIVGVVPTNVALLVVALQLAMLPAFFGLVTRSSWRGPPQAPGLSRRRRRRRLLDRLAGRRPPRVLDQALEAQRRPFDHVVAQRRDGEREHEGHRPLRGDVPRVDLEHDGQVVEEEGVGDQADPQQNAVGEQPPHQAARLVAEHRRDDHAMPITRVQRAAPDPLGGALSLAVRPVQPDLRAHDPEGQQRDRPGDPGEAVERPQPRGQVVALLVPDAQNGEAHPGGEHVQEGSGASGGGARCPGARR